jgi:PST family polysaccharide transporter
MLGGAEALAGFYREPSLALLFRLGAVALVLAVLGGVRSAFLQGLQRIHALAALGALTAAAMLGFTLALAPWLGLAGIILASILTEAVVWGCTARILWTAAEEFRDARGPRVAPPATLPLLGRAFHIAAPSFLSALGVGVVAWALRSFLGQRLGFEAVGLYQVADAASRVLTLVSGAVAVPLVPAVAEMDAARSERLGAGLETILRATLVVTLPPALFLATGAGPLLTLVFGRTYAAAGPVASWLALAAMLQALWTVLWSAQVGTGRIWAGFAVAATGQALLLAGAVVLAPRWGLAGVGAAVAGSQAVSLALALGHVGRRLRTTFPGLGALAGVAGVGWAAVLMLGELGAHGVVSAAFLAAAAALGVATLLRPAERRLVVEILGPLLTRGSRRG